MATVIQIKRSAANTAPSTSDLALAEMAYAYDASNDGAGAKLYIEALDSSSTQVVHAIGGKYFTDQIDDATNANTASTIVKRDGSGNFSAGTITADLTGDVTGDVTGTVSDVSNHDTDDISEGSTNLYHTTARARAAISASGDISYDSATGVISFTNDAGDIESVTAGAGLTGGGTAGDVTLNIGAGTGVTVAADEISIGQDVATSASVTFAGVTAPLTGNVTGDVTGNVTGDVTGNADTATALETSRNFSATGDVTASAVSFDGTGNVALSTTLATVNSDVGSYGSATAIPAITVDAKGRITAISTSSISTALTVGADSGTADSVTLGTDTLNFVGTANEIETTVSNNQIQVGLVTNPTVGGNLTVTGNLTVSGTTTTVDSQTLSVVDPLIALASGNNSTDAVDIGFYGLYDTSGSQDLYAGLFRDAGDGKFKLFKDSQSAPTTTVDTGATGYSVASLVANLEGNVTGTVSSIANHDTDDLTEGSTNLYYTDARFNSAFDTRLAAATIDGGTY